MRQEGNRFTVLNQYGCVGGVEGSVATPRELGVEECEGRDDETWSGGGEGFRPLRLQNI